MSDKEEFEKEFLEMLERAERLGYKPLASKDNFSARVFGLRSLYLGGKDDTIEGEMFYAPKNNPIEMMTDYFMHLIDENTKELIHAWCEFAGGLFVDGVEDNAFTLDDCENDKEIAERFAEILMQGVHMLLKSPSTWRKFMSANEIDLPQVVLMGQPDAIANMIATTDSGLVDKVNSASVDDFIKQVLTESEEEE